MEVTIEIEDEDNAEVEAEIKTVDETKPMASIFKESEVVILEDVTRPRSSVTNVKKLNTKSLNAEQMSEWSKLMLLRRMEIWF
ncbi:unnamed protein product [Rhodiola kirilowii]